jgi:hypothetical protein
MPLLGWHASTPRWAGARMRHRKSVSVYCPAVLQAICVRPSRTCAVPAKSGAHIPPLRLYAIDARGSSHRLRKLLDLFSDHAFPSRPDLLLSKEIPRPDRTLPRPMTLALGARKVVAAAEIAGGIEFFGAVKSIWRSRPRRLIRKIFGPLSLKLREELFSGVEDYCGRNQFGIQRIYEWAADGMEVGPRPGYGGARRRRFPQSADGRAHSWLRWPLPGASGGAAGVVSISRLIQTIRALTISRRFRSCNGTGCQLGGSRMLDSLAR